MRPGSTAFMPKAPKLSVVPPLARPWTRPLCALRYLLRFGLSIRVSSQGFAPAPLVARRLPFGQALFVRHRVMGEDLAFEHPDLDAADPVSRLGSAVAEIDIGSQRMQRDPALPIPLHAGDFGAAQPAGAIDPDPLRSEPHRRLDRALHRPAKRDAPLQLLRDAVGDQLGLDLGLADLDDVEADLTVGKLRNVAAQFLDVRALFADHHTWPRGMQRDPCSSGGAFDDHPGHPGLAEPLMQEPAQAQVVKQQIAVFLPREPAGIPGAIDAEPKPDRIDLLTHYALSSARSRTMTVR